MHSNNSWSWFCWGKFHISSQGINNSKETFSVTRKYKKTYFVSMNKSTQVRKSPDFINKQFIKFIWFVHNQTLNQRAFMSGLTSKLFLNLNDLGLHWHSLLVFYRNDNLRFKWFTTSASIHRITIPSQQGH